MGDRGVGKSTLRRQIHDLDDKTLFRAQYVPTQLPEVITLFEFQLRSGTDVTFKIIDTNGNISISEILKGNNGRAIDMVILIYDSTSVESFNNVYDKWYSGLSEALPESTMENLNVILLGTKKDLDTHADINESEVFLM